MMKQVMINLNIICLYLDTQLFLGLPWMMTWALKVVLYTFLSDGAVEHGRRYRNSPPQMGRLVIGLDLRWPYMATVLLLEPVAMTLRGAVVADMVTCTPILVGS